MRNTRQKRQYRESGFVQVTEAVTTGWISSLGSYVTQFEADFAAFCGTDHAIAVTNGTAALHLSLHAHGIGPGDEVIVPDLSFIATANAVLMTGATPVFADIESEYLCLDPETLSALITSRTRAIVPVHIYGHAADMTAINRIAKDHGLAVIEDAAEAHGAAIDGQRVGGLGACGTFSFYANKCLTTGEGGMITTNNTDLAARMRHQRDHAMSPDKRYWHDQMGFNYRMTNLQAAIGCAQMTRAEEFLAARRAVFAAYQHGLADVPGVRLNRRRPATDHAYWMICLEVDGLTFDARDDLARRLRAGGVDTRPYFYPMSDMPYLTQADTPISHAVAPTGLNLPTYAELTSDEVATICNVIKAEVARC